MKDTDPGVAQPLYVRAFGQGPRQALALHCTIAHSGTWRGLAGEIGDDVTLTTPDFLSHGRSPDWDRQGDYQDRIVHGCLPSFDQRMDLIGHSFGATVALRLAALHPDRVRSLTLIEPVFFAVAIADDPVCVAQHEEDASPFTSALAQGDEALGARLFNRMWSTGDAPRWPELADATRAAMIRGIHVVPASRAAIYEDLAGLLKPGVLDRITAPVQLLRGSLTHPIIEVVNTGLCARLPNAQSAVIEGEGHMLPITNSRETARFIRDLFQRAP